MNKLRDVRAKQQASILPVGTVKQPKVHGTHASPCLVARVRVSVCMCVRACVMNCHDLASLYVHVASSQHACVHVGSVVFKRVCACGVIVEAHPARTS